MTSFGVSKIVTTTMLSIVLICSACASPGQSTAVPAGNPTAPAHGSPSFGPADIKEKVAKPLDAKAPSRYQPVVRDGKARQRHVEARTGRLAKATAVRYPDGVEVLVQRIAHRVEQAQGPGTFSDRHYTSIAMVIRNRSKSTIDLSQVVVTATYGSSPARVAAPVYADSTITDFSGSLRPGNSASAEYAFAIPTEQSSKVLVIVDFDDVHDPAKFAGAAG